MGKNNFVEYKIKLVGDTTVNYIKPKGLFNLQPNKNNYLRSSSKKKLNLFKRTSKTAVQAKKSVR